MTTIKPPTHLGLGGRSIGTHAPAGPLAYEQASPWKPPESGFPPGFPRLFMGKDVEFRPPMGIWPLERPALRLCWPRRFQSHRKGVHERLDPRQTRPLRAPRCEERQFRRTRGAGDRRGRRSVGRERRDRLPHGRPHGRSPKDKYLEDVPAIHDKIWWGKVNTPVTPQQFDMAARDRRRSPQLAPQAFTSSRATPARTPSTAWACAS
jgi:hypothetical protein